MSSIQDERGYNQGFKLNVAQNIRLIRRADKICSEMNLPANINLRDNIKILEIGCGTGELSNILSKKTFCKVTGIDISNKFIEIATNRYQSNNLNFAVYNLTNYNINFPSIKYDYIVGNGILHHLYNDLGEFLPKIKLMLNTEGKLIFWEPNYNNPYIYFIFKFNIFRKLAKLEPCEMAFTRNYIVKLLNKSGYKSVSAIESDFLLPSTPKKLIKFAINLSNILECCSLTRIFAQSLFITCKNND